MVERAPNNIRRLREGAKLTQAELAARIAGSPHFTTIQKLEAGKTQLTQDWMVRIAQALGVSPAALIDSGVSFEPARQVPLIGLIAAGNWREAVHDPQGFIPATRGGPNAFALKPTGDSMDLVIGPNAVVIVDPDDFELLDGKYYAVMREGGETTFKRYRDAPARLEPCSSNPAHQTIYLGREPIVVIGRVVQQSSDL